jgi:hypothetical protein
MQSEHVGESAELVREPGSRGAEPCPWVVMPSLFGLQPYEQGGLPFVLVVMPDLFGRLPFEWVGMPYRLGQEAFAFGQVPLTCRPLPHAKARLPRSNEGMHWPRVGEKYPFRSEHYPCLGESYPELAMLEPHRGTPYEDDDRIPEESRGHRVLRSVLAVSRSERSERGARRSGHETTHSEVLAPRPASRAGGT